ncbi:hypothetical protein [Lapidilactobacillus wuchangensis]|nr:hypothetical protein [Lapidilactobacillus wuchangensis]
MAKHFEISKDPDNDFQGLRINIDVPSWVTITALVGIAGLIWHHHGKNKS